MSSIDKAVATQLANIQKKTGKTLDELYALLSDSGLEKHGQMVSMLKSDLAMGHGDANTVVHLFRQSKDSASRLETRSTPTTAARNRRCDRSTTQSWRRSRASAISRSPRRRPISA